MRTHGFRRLSGDFFWGRPKASKIQGGREYLWMNELFEAKDLNLLSDDPFVFFWAEFLYVQILNFTAWYFGKHWPARLLVLVGWFYCFFTFAFSTDISGNRITLKNIFSCIQGSRINSPSENSLAKS